MSGRRLPLCSPAEIREELAEITRGLDRAHYVAPVSLEAEARRVERVACLQAWHDGLTGQLAEQTA